MTMFGGLTMAMRVSEIKYKLHRLSPVTPVKFADFTGDKSVTGEAHRAISGKKSGFEIEQTIKACFRPELSQASDFVFTFQIA